MGTFKEMSFYKRPLLEFISVQGLVIGFTDSKANENGFIFQNPDLIDQANVIDG